MMAARGLEFEAIRLANNTFLEPVLHSRLLDGVKTFVQMDLRLEVVEYLRLAEEKIMTYPSGRREAFWRTVWAPIRLLSIRIDY
jgi:hypothetical protein